MGVWSLARRLAWSSLKNKVKKRFFVLAFDRKYWPAKQTKHLADKIQTTKLVLFYGNSEFFKKHIL